jgi:sulfite reductase alpha subunit-like flavoprotein
LDYRIVSAMEKRLNTSMQVNPTTSLTTLSRAKDTRDKEEPREKPADLTDFLTQKTEKEDRPPLSPHYCK